MRKASISEAKNRLSALLDRVRNGQTITIEDRGVPVARLEPIVGARVDPAGRALRLERLGLVRPPSAALPPAFLSARRPWTSDARNASDLVREERRDGR